MGIYNKNIRNNNGISYSKEVDGPSDWINIESETYFKDLSDSLIYYKNSNDVVISIFEEGGVKTADNGLNISTGGDVELGGTLNKDTDINGNNKTLNLGTLTDAFNGININSITSTRTHTFPGFDSITSEYTPGNLTINSVSLSGTQTHQNTTTPLQYRREISDTSTNITSYINLQDQLTFSSENTSTSQSSSLVFATNQTSLSHSSGSGTSNVFTQADSETSLYYSGNTQNGITITGDTLNLYGPETNIDLNISGSIFTDNRVSGSTKGLEYGDDYHLGFTDRTLVDKAYVDNSIINNITASSGSGLTFNTTTNKIDLGGTLTEHTYIKGLKQIHLGFSTGLTISGFPDSLSLLAVTSFGGTVTLAPGSSGYFQRKTGAGDNTWYADTSTVDMSFNPESNITNIKHHINEQPGSYTRSIYITNDLEPLNKLNHDFSVANGWIETSLYRDFGSFVVSNKISNNYSGVAINGQGITSAWNLQLGGTNGDTHILTNPTSTLSLGLNEHSFTDLSSSLNGVKLLGFGEDDNDDTTNVADYTTLVNTSLVPKKYVDDVIVNNITGSAGAGLTFNTTTGKIDLGGILDNDNPSNNFYFIPSTGSNMISWGSDALGDLPVIGGSKQYISRFNNVSLQGEYKLIGHSNNTTFAGVVGCFEGQGANVYLKQYKDISSNSITNSPDAANAMRTFEESDSPNYWSRTIWQSHNSNTKSVSNASYDKHTSEVYNTNGHKSEVTLTETWFQSIVRNPDNSKTGQLMVGYYGISLLDGDSMGIQSFPNSILIGNSSTAEGLTIGMGSTDSKYTEGSTNKKGIKYSGFGETDGDTGVDADYTTLVNTSLVPKKYVDDIISNINGDNLSNANLTFDGSYYSDLNDNSWQLKDSTGANRILLDVQQGNANGHGIGYGGDAVDGKHTFYNTASSGTEALCNMSFLNGLKLSGGSLENDYLNFGSAGFSIKIKSNVSHGASIGVYPDVVLKAGHSSYGVILDTNNYVKFKKDTVEHSLIDSSSRWILRGSSVIGDENISLQDDTLIKGSNNSVNTSGLKVTDINNASLLDIRNNGQTCWGGAKVNNVAHIMYNPSGQASSLLRLMENNGNLGINLATDGRIESNQGGTTTFKTYRQGGVPHIELYHTSFGKIVDLQSGASHIDSPSLTLGGQTGKVGAKVSIMQASAAVNQQLFFGNITTNTAGRLGSSGSFGTDQKGLECFDTDLNKKLVWNGTTWEEISSGSSVDNSIYTVDDSLTDNRIVDLGGYNLTFQKLSTTTEYTKIYRNGGLEIRGSGFDVGDDVFKVKYKTNGNDLLSIGTNGGVTINSSISMGQFNATWNYGQQFSDGYISFFHGATWNDNEAIRFDLRNNTDASLTFNRNGQNTAGNRFIVRNSVLYETNYGTSKEQISLQGNTLIKGDSGLERTPYNFKIVNSSGDNTFVSNDDKSIEVYGRTELLSKDHGILLNRVDISEMNSITASDNEIVYNTELESLYRYDDPSGSWIALASGYGMVGIVRDSDNGVPKFYSDLQSALDTCKAVGSYNTVTLYGNVTTTSGIIIDNTFDYKNLTINFNGFKIENNQADDTHCLTVEGLIADTTTVLLDGNLIRENGTTGRCLQSDGTGARNLQMSKMYFYNENYMTFQIGSNLEDIYDFGGSIFESGPNATINTVRLSYSNFRNFTVIGRSSQTALFLTNSADASNFTVISKGTGDGVTTQTSCIASNFYVESNSGNATSGGILSNFVAKSVSGIAVSGPNSAHDFVATTGNNYAVTMGVAEISNFRAENNSSTLPCINLTNTLQCVQGYVMNRGSHYAINVFRNQASRNYSYNRITAISEGGIAANISSNTGFKVLFSHCEFVSKWNDVGGHSVQIGGNDTVLTNCSFRVNNVGANNIMASSSITTKVANSTFDGATTPINSNVTLSNTFTSDPYGNVTL